MPEYHKVAQGEYLAKIAAQYGFNDFHTIWDHPKNAALKQKRQNPNVLFPGDVLFIPDKQDKQEARGTTQVHKFQIKPPAILLRIVVTTFYEKPVANTPCDLRLKNQVRAITTDDAGKFEQSIALSDDIAQLTLHDTQTAQTPIAEVAVQFKIGHLDPPEELSGQKARLANLGYYIGPVQDTDGNRFRSAVEEFQCDHQLPVNGVCNAQTQAKLKEIHGC